MNRDSGGTADHNTGKIIACALIVFAFFSLLAFLPVLILLAHPSNAVTPFVAFLLLLLALFIALLVMLLARSKVIDTFNWRAKHRESLIKLASTIGFGILFTGALNVAAISFTQAQFNLANHSTFPALELKAKTAEDSTEYLLSSSIGSASHISVSIKDRCYFRYNNTPCMLEILQPTSITEGTGSIDLQTRQVTFRSDRGLTEIDDAKDILTETIRARIPNAEFIQVGRCFEVEFFDFQNQRATYHFSEQDDAIRLSQTTPHYVYENNCGTLAIDPWAYEEAALTCLDDLLERFVPAND